MHRARFSFNIKRPRVVSKLESAPYTKGEKTKDKIHRARFSFDIQHLLEYTSLDRLALVHVFISPLAVSRACIFTSHMVGSNYHVHIVLGFLTRMFTSPLTV